MFPIKKNEQGQLEDNELNLELEEVEESFIPELEDDEINIDIDSEEDNLQETGLVFSDNDNKLLAVVKVEDVVNIGINPRLKLNEKNIEELTAVESSEIVPILLGYITEDIEHEGVSLKEKLILVDGEHRYASRIKGNHKLIKANIKKYSNMRDLKKDAFTSNITHGMRLSQEEIQRKANEILRSDEKYISFRKLAKEYGINRGYFERLSTKIKIEEALTARQDTASLAILQKMPSTFFRPLTSLSKESDIVIQNFFTNFSQLLLSFVRPDILKRLRENVDLYLEGKITTYTEYNEMKDNEYKEKDESNIFEMFNDTQVMTLETPKNEYDKEKEEIVQKYLKKEEKPIFSIKSFSKNLFEDSKAKVASLREIFGNNNYKIEADEETIDKSIEEVRKAKKQLEEVEEMLLSKKNK